MRISETCIRRPVFATVMTLVLTLLGLVSYQRLAVREFPNVDTPSVTVTTRYRGADARIVETQVTQVLEDSLAGIEGIDFLTSTSRPEQSQITVTFNLARNADATASGVCAATCPTTSTSRSSSRWRATRAPCSTSRSPASATRLPRSATTRIAT